jgi:RNA polymerase sigma factor (sigma-70 family)
VNPIDRLTRCFSEVREELLGFLTRRTGRVAAEDALQDVWLNLRERGDATSWREPRAVLFATAANLAADAYRRDAREHNLFCRDADRLEAVCPRPDPEAQADATGCLDRLSHALEQLPAACREAFLLNRIEGLSHVEIAARLGVSTKTIQRNIERALRHCAQAIE